MFIKVIVATIVLCIAASVIMVPLDIHPLFAIIPLLTAMVSVLVVLLTIGKVCAALLPSLLYGAGVGALVGSAVSVAFLALLTVVGWTDGGHGGAVYIALFSLGVIASFLFGISAAFFAQHT